MWREQLMAEIDEIEQEIADLRVWLSHNEGADDYEKKERKLRNLKYNRRSMIDEIEGDYDG